MFMKPIATEKIEPNNQFMYEVKYDGFRAQLLWSKSTIQLISRNKKDLTKNFPEIVHACIATQAAIESCLPVQLDGELVILNNEYEANFSLIQKRGRLKSTEKIALAKASRKATFIAFDLIEWKGKLLIKEALIARKKLLTTLFENVKEKTLRQIETFHNYEDVAKLVYQYKGEGIIAKRKASTYIDGKKHRDWLKEKNWRTIDVFLTEYNQQNDYFQIAIYDETEIKQIGKCKHGLTDEEYSTLQTLFTSNGTKANDLYRLPPAICAKIHTLDLHENELREPEFAGLIPEMNPEDCTKEKCYIDLAMLPDVGISNVDKVFWPKQSLTKGELLIYMREVFPYMIPYLKDRALTVIRCPDGIHEETFFQKNVPSYAPDYVESVVTEGKRMQICNNLESLVWFANHSAIEYHVPFQPINTVFPTEIVFDLDPPSRDHFSLAVKAAIYIKQIMDELELTAFIKTSGNKGLQIHLPLHPDTISYDETAIFTEAIAKTIEKASPTLFTTERLKKNRGEKLYIDYVQHGKNKTIIAPYSPRKTEEATVATPIFWEELKEELVPTKFTIRNVINRVQTVGCPWLNEFEKARKQNGKKLKEISF